MKQNQKPEQVTDTGAISTATHFPLLRRFSITSLAAMFITAAILIFLYQQDQFAEHEDIAAQENEKTVVHLSHLLDNQINSLISAAEGLDTQALLANPNIGLFTAAQELVLEHHIVKLKIFNPSGIVIYSSVAEEIGATTKHSDLLEKALRGEVQHRLEFRNTILAPSGELHDRYIANTYMPLTRAEKRIGVIEIYADATPIIQRIYSKTISIALVVLGAFAALYAALFFSLFRTDRAVAKWQKTIADNTQKLTVSEQRFRDVSDAAGEYLWEIDANMVYTYVSNRSIDVKGYSPEELLGHTPMEFMPEEDLAPVGEIVNRAIANKAPFNLQHRDISKSGAVLWEEVNGVPFYDENGTVIGLRGAGLNITERKQIETALRESEERLRATIDTSMDAVVQINAEGIITGWNSQTEAVFGWLRLEMIGRAIHETIIPLQHREAHAQGMKHFLLTGDGPILSKRIEITGLHRDGHEFPIELTVAPIKMGGKYEFSAFIRDITKKKESEALIWKQANFDLLTDLPNRHMFHDRMEQEIKKATRGNLKFALLFIDLDRFKEINDTLGHDVGDLLLVEAARRITDCVRTTDIVARLGGDEFTVLLADIDDVSSVERVTQNIIQSLATAFQLTNEASYVSASIGVTLYPDDADDQEGLLKNADQAMYVAKEQGRNRHSYFTRTMQEAAQTKLRLINDLRGALPANQFMVYFQPIVELATGNIHKAEALLRWQHPERGMVSPVEFIPLAEETGLILEIGDWVFHESMRWAKHWRALYNPTMQVSVNKSPVQFYKDGDDHAAWLSHLQKMDLPGQGLAIEITEGLLLDSNASILDALLKLRDTGIQVSMDDFGTGYSSLSYLKKFDIDYLKIDQSFVRNMATDHSDLVLCEAIIVMAHKLDIKVIAEGVETAEQRDLLTAAGCDYAQGYLYSRPVPAEEFEELLKLSCL